MSEQFTITETVISPVSIDGPVLMRAEVNPAWDCIVFSDQMNCRQDLWRMCMAYAFADLPA